MKENLRLQALAVLSLPLLGLCSAGCVQQSAQDALSRPTPTPLPSPALTAVAPTPAAMPDKAPSSPAPATSAAPLKAAAAAGSGKMIKTASGLQYEDISLGSGPAIKAGDFAQMKYTGTLTNGTKFDSTDDHGGAPFPFQLGVGSVIKGWDEGVAGMKAGGKRKLLIPPDLGYGAAGSGPIPPNSPLIFMVELVSFSDKPAGP